MSLSASAKQKMLRMESFAKFPYLIEVTIDNTVYYLANSDTDISYNGHTYSASWFQLTPPDRTQSSIGNGKVSFSNLDQWWTEQVRLYDDKPLLRFIAVIQYEENGSTVCEAIEDYKFKLSSPNWNETQISWTMEYDSRQSLKVPAYLCDSSLTPAVV